MVLCNQGCGTHVYFKDKRPYNVLDKKKHDCPMLHMAKLWGGRYNTIPMSPVKYRIDEAYDHSILAQRSRNIDVILNALQITLDNLEPVVKKMREQEAQNTEWSNELEAYKKKLVDDQKRREERKNG